MSFGFGVGDALTALNIIFDIAMKLKDESKELAKVAKKIRQVKDRLSLLETKMKNSASLVGQAGPKFKAMLEEDSSDIKAGCQKCEKILGERARMHKFELGSKTWFVLTRIPELQGIIGGFDVTTTSIDQKFTFLLMDAAERASDNDAKAKKKAEANEKKMQDKLNKMRSEMADQAKNLEKVVHLLEKQSQKSVQDAVLGRGDSKKDVDKWTDALVEAGMSRKDARSMLEKRFAAARTERQGQEQILKRAATDEAKLAKKTPIKPIEGKRYASILCVDEGNGTRSIVAQTYLEFVRLWTMNTEKRWFIHRIDSAGIAIPTNFTAPRLQRELVNYKPIAAGTAPWSVALEAVAGEPWYFRSDDYPKEKETVLNHIKNHRTQGLSEYHFKHFDHIVCFDDRTLRFLNHMRNASTKPIAKIHLFPSCEWWRHGGDAKLKNKEQLAPLVEALKLAIKRFLKDQLDWERPRENLGINGGEWRTAQTMIGKEFVDKLERDNQRLARETYEKSGCRVYWAYDAVSRMWLMSLSGPKAKLDAAQKTILS